MLKVKIDSTCFPVVRVESNGKLVPPHRATCVLEFEPNALRKHDFLLYFQEKED